MVGRGKEGTREGLTDVLPEPAVTHCDHWRAEMHRIRHNSTEQTASFLLSIFKFPFSYISVIVS